MDFYYQNPPTKKKFIPKRVNSDVVYKNDVSASNHSEEDIIYLNIEIVRPEPNQVNVNEFKHSKSFIQLFDNLKYKKTCIEKCFCKKVSFIQKVQRTRNKDFNLDERKKVLKILESFEIDSQNFDNFGLIDLYLLATLLEIRGILISVSRNSVSISDIPKFIDDSLNVFEEHFRNFQVQENMNFFFSKTRDYIVEHFNEQKFRFGREQFKNYLVTKNPQD